ncbi:dATP/dGTP diphosphohydrolase domain-containing protein [Mesorhizobium sp. WSM2239]|uniref:dATP/dGTP diphosphohydrolase domain-containing protein n=2 Tax=unclassified Mesorhizobium TaxID=325217 RepID=A0AAU8D0F0_9HYPH
MDCIHQNCSYSKATGTCSNELCNFSRKKPTNPKQAFGDKKPPLGYIPLSALLALLEALYDGKLKYTPLNWRENPVEAMTYVEAAIRHLQLWKVGEEITRDTLVSNLGAVMACCTILIDAQVHGTLIDNRWKSQVEADLLHAAEHWVERLKEKQKERERTLIVDGNIRTDQLSA